MFKDRWGQTPLYVATKRGNIQAAALLFQKGGNLQDIADKELREQVRKTAIKGFGPRFVINRARHGKNGKR